MQGIYSNEFREELIDDDEISAEEYFFMLGYESEDLDF